MYPAVLKFVIIKLHINDYKLKLYRDFLPAGADTISKKFKFTKKGKEIEKRI